jgi:hypothetical protein
MPGPPKNKKIKMKTQNILSEKAKPKCSPMPG